jgi:Asp-tRNA(Asn)/Glu-tRNA(Gln) amidotransferase A subunit family amidase
MKAIISQPMKGKTEAQVRAEREEAIEHLNSLGYEVVDTIFPDFTNRGNIPLKYLAKSIEFIADVDLVYFIGDWRNARGCQIEFNCCVQYGVPFRIEQ